MFKAVTIQDADGNDVELYNNDRLLGECQGLHGTPVPRRLTRNRPGGHGEINTTKHYGSRQPIWSGTIFDAGTGLWAAYDTILSALWGAVEEERLLKWTREDDVELQTYVKLADALDPVIRVDDAGRYLAYQLIFDREDPRNYTQAIATVVGEELTSAAGGLTFDAPFPWTFSPSGAGQVVVYNDGTIPTPGTFRIYGYGTSPQILQVETGLKMVFDGVISAGDYLEVDTARRSVLLNGTTDRTNLVDFSGSDWRAGDIPVGGCTYRLLASNFDVNARLDVLSRDAFA